MKVFPVVHIIGKMEKEWLMKEKAWERSQCFVNKVGNVL